MSIPSSPNFGQADGGIRNDEPGLLRATDRNPAQKPGTLELT
jgi:hypothetical protein